MTIKCEIPYLFQPDTHVVPNTYLYNAPCLRHVSQIKRYSHNDGVLNTNVSRNNTAHNVAGAAPVLQMSVTGQYECEPPGGKASASNANVLKSSVNACESRATIQICIIGMHQLCICTCHGMQQCSGNNVTSKAQHSSLHSQLNSICHI